MFPGMGPLLPLRNLFQCFTTPTIEHFYLVSNLNQLSINFKPLPFLLSLFPAKKFLIGPLSSTQETQVSPKFPINRVSFCVTSNVANKGHQEYQSIFIYALKHRKKMLCRWKQLTTAWFAKYYWVLQRDRNSIHPFQFQSRDLNIRSYF